MKIRMSAGQTNVEHFVKNVMDKHHIKPENKNDLLFVYEEIKKCIRPYALYKMNQRDTGVKDIDNRQSAIVAMTLGEGVDELKESFVNEGRFDEAYLLECIAGELLTEMYASFNKEYEKYHRRYIERYVFIGEEIPTSVIPWLLSELKSYDEITADENGVFVPSKSTVFYAILTENPNFRYEDKVVE